MSFQVGWMEGRVELILLMSNMAERIAINFFWSGMRYSDFASHVTCVKMTFKHAQRSVPLGETPIIDIPFERVALDLVEPIKPTSQSGNTYIFTVVDYTTRYAEAVVLQNIDTVTVA